MTHLLQSIFLPAVAVRPDCNSDSFLRRNMHVRAIREIFMPALSSTMTEGKIVSWLKSEGDKVSKGEGVVVVESDKADMDVETFYDGYVAAVMVDEGGVAPVGSAIAFLAETEEEIPVAREKAKASFSSSSDPVMTPVNSSSKPQQQPEKLPDIVAPVDEGSTHPSSEGGRRVVASPYAKKLAKELKVVLQNVVGSGPHGRIVAKDVEMAASGAVEIPPSPLQATPMLGSVEMDGSMVPFTTMQLAVSRNMVDSLAVPSFRVGYTITVNALEALYQKIRAKGVTMTALLAKATALALVKHPIVNSGCRDGKSCTYNTSINIAIAVAMDGGLITPVLQDADKVDIYSLSRKWKELVRKARTKQLNPNEYNSGTFAISNLGMFGVDRFDAILPPGIGAIMAIGSSQRTVVATDDGSIGVKNQMQVNVTADHRIIYGADLASFLQTFAGIVQDPVAVTL